MDTGVMYGPANSFVEQARPPSSTMWTLNKDRLTIGRDASSDVCVDDPSVSGHHANFVRRGSSWAIVDAGSTNGTYVNGVRIVEVPLRPGDRIGIGSTELVLRMPGADPGAHPGPPPIRYDVGSQVGTVSNVAGNQSNYTTESNLRYIASRRGRARLLIVSGILLFFLGNGLGLAAILPYVDSVFTAVRTQSTEPPTWPTWMIPAFGAGAFMSLVGIVMFIFGLITRSGAKREARRIGAEWS
jgi:hypothetical protein